MRAVRRFIEKPPSTRRGRPAHFAPLPAVWRWVMAGTLAVALALGGTIAHLRSRPAAAAATVPLAWGTVEATVDAEAIVVRRERVYTAPVAGQVRRLVEDGQRVRVGATPVQMVTGAAAALVAETPALPRSQSEARHEMDDLSAQIYALAIQVNEAKYAGEADQAANLQAELDRLSVRQGELAGQLSQTEPAAPVAAPAPAPAGNAPAGLTDVTVEGSGVLVYQLDGLEQALSGAAAADWNPAWFRRLAPAPRRIGQGNVAKGAPVFKVVDNLSLGLLLVVPEASLARLASDGELQLRFPGRSAQPVSGRVVRRVAEKGEALLQISAGVVPEELTELRRVRVTLVMASETGMIAPRSSIDVRDGQQGVWAEIGRDYAFYPVRVTGGTNEHVALETALPVGTRILRQAPTHID